MKKPHVAFLGLALALGASVADPVSSSAAPSSESGTGPSSGAPVPVEPRVVGRLRSIRILLHTSSVARKVEASGNADAQQVLADARTVYDQAADLHRRGDDPAAEATLDRVVVMIREAVRLARTGLEDAALQERLYRERESTVLALLAAHRRVAAAKGITEEKREIEGRAAGILERAQGLFRNKQVADAQIELNNAYRLIRASIYSMHNGDTERSGREFKTIVEEYDYELDRNSSYKMLVFVLLADRGLDAGTVKRIELTCSDAEAAASEARALAERGQHREAVEKLFWSSRLYARAIRMGGVYIPD